MTPMGESLRGGGRVGHEASGGRVTSPIQSVARLQWCRGLLSFSMQPVLHLPMASKPCCLLLVVVAPMSESLRGGGRVDHEASKLTSQIQPVARPQRSCRTLSFSMQPALNLPLVFKICCLLLVVMTPMGESLR